MSVAGITIEAEHKTVERSTVALNTITAVGAGASTILKPRPTRPSAPLAVEVLAAPIGDRVHGPRHLHLGQAVGGSAEHDRRLRWLPCPQHCLPVLKIGASQHQPLKRLGVFIEISETALVFPHCFHSVIKAKSLCKDRSDCSVGLFAAHVAHSIEIAVGSNVRWPLPTGCTKTAAIRAPTTSRLNL